jgi:hypothetical protein
LKEKGKRGKNMGREKSKPKDFFHFIKFEAIRALMIAELLSKTE